MPLGDMDYFGLYILSRLSSVLMSEDVAASVYAILNEYAVHAVCLVLGLVCGVFLMENDF